VYARHEGAVAAPTAGLHFTPELLLGLRDRGIHLVYITLHIGLDTFRPVTEEQIAEHTIHSEWARLAPEAAEVLNQARLAGGRIVAIGTTAVRVLETAALRSAGVTGSLQHASQLTTEICPWRPVAAFEGWTDLYIYPGFHFRATDALITNFHLPRSSLLMLVSAFAGREFVLEVYRQAIDCGYRFYSFGDATLCV
jgi:S-adenosylmethionine:tRNA ribosyltransferase-isomerase